MMQFKEDMHGILNTFMFLVQQILENPLFINKLNSLTNKYSQKEYVKSDPILD